MANKDNAPGKGGAMDYHEYKRMLEARRKQTGINNQPDQSNNAPDQAEQGVFSSEEQFDAASVEPGYDDFAEQTFDADVGADAGTGDVDAESDPVSVDGEDGSVQPRARKRNVTGQFDADVDAAAPGAERDQDVKSVPRVRRPDENGKNVQRRPSAPMDRDNVPRVKKAVPKSAPNARRTEKPAQAAKKGGFLATLLSPHTDERGFDYDEFYELDDAPNGTDKNRRSESGNKPGAKKPRPDASNRPADRPAVKKPRPAAGTSASDKPAARKPRPDANRPASDRPVAKKTAARDRHDPQAGFDPIMSGYERANAELRHSGKRRQEEVDPLKLEAERRRRKQEELKRQLEIEDELLQYEVSTDNSDVAPEVLKPYEDRYDDEDGDNAEWNGGIKRALKKSKSGIAALASKARVGKSKSDLYHDLESAFDEVEAETKAAKKPVMAGFALPVTDEVVPRRSSGGKHGVASSADENADGYIPEHEALSDEVPLRRRRQTATVAAPEYDEYDADVSANNGANEAARRGVSSGDEDIVVSSRRSGKNGSSDEKLGEGEASDASSSDSAEPETRASHRSKSRASSDYSIFMPPSDEGSANQSSEEADATKNVGGENKSGTAASSSKKGVKYMLTKARSRKYDLSDIAPEDDDVQIYKPSKAVSADIPEIPTPYDDDDELDDKTTVKPRSRSHSSISPSKGDVRLADLPGDPALTDDSLSDDDYDETAHGGCLRAVLILVGIIAVLCALIWGLDHFGVIRINDVTDKVRGIFDFSKQEEVVVPVDATATGTIPSETAAPADAASADSAPVNAAAVNASGAAGITLADGAASQDAQTAEQTSAPTTAPTAIPEHTASPVSAAVLPKADGLDVEFGIYDDYNKNNDYVRDEKIYFGQGSDYTELEGVITFRGNNYRDTAAYGTAALDKKDFKIVWTKEIGAIDSGYAVWTGVGWNGQPVMVRWSDEMRNMMNLYDEKKAKSDLVEVIYGALDGYVYFLDAEDGTRTRDAIKLGFPIKGSVSIDPRGYPLLYVGQGISLADGVRGKIGWRVYNLLNQEHMYLLNGHDDLRFRTHGSFDGVCLVDADTDTVIEGAENGIFYTINLNTEFDPTVPSISIDPKVVLYRYKSHGYNKDGSEALGIENSVAAYGPYAFFADNSGLFTCLDLNNMSPVWCTDVSDDTDSSTVLEVEPDGEVALYTASEVDKQGSSGNAYMRKFNAMTGELIWENSVQCETDGTNGGGAFATPALGKNSLSQLVYFTMARTDEGGTIFAYDKDTGKVVWKKSTKRFAWSSPVLVYNEEGYGVVLQANSKGTLYMYDGLTGETLSSIELGSNVEGSPAVVNDMLVVGTRGQQIIGVKIL